MTKSSPAMQNSEEFSPRSHKATIQHLPAKAWTGQPYPAYKDSGVEWLGKVPEHWTMRRLKYTVSFTGGGTPSKANASFWSGSIPWVSPKDMARSRLDDTTDHISRDAVTASAASVVAPGAVLLVVRSGILSRTIPVAINMVPMALNQDMKALRPRHGIIESEYLHGLIEGNQAFLLREWTKQGATVESIEHCLLAKSLIPLPPLSEQHAIAHFLDHVTQRIQHHIHAKEKLIKLLEEQKQVIIHQAVTGQIDVRTGRPYPAYKDSGVEWLGEVPEHWEVRRIKSLSVVKRGASPRPIADAKCFEEEGEYAWIRIADVTASDRYLKNTTQRLSPLGQSLSVQLLPGSLFLSIAGSVGKPIITKIKCCIHDGFVYFPEFRGDAEFLYRVLSCKTIFSRLGKFGTQLNLNTDTVGGICLDWPPQAERHRIGSSLDKSTGKIDRLISSTRHEIDLLHEYRTRLISDVVTGKMDVREAAAHFPQGDPLAPDANCQNGTELADQVRSAHP